MALSPDMRRKLMNVSRAQVLSPSMCAIWDAMGIGVTAIDADGICEYMNPIQRQIDKLDDVVGKHITSLYIPHDLQRIPSIECLQKGKPVLRKFYTTKTVNDVKINTVTDFFPLFDNGIKDGVLVFTMWLDGEVLAQLGMRQERAGRNGGRTALYSFDDIVGKDPTLQAILDAARSAAESASPVMIWGESGTGKELFAQAIHSSSNRKHSPFVPVNCAAIPETLLESILFGTAKGAYTDAPDKPGLFEEANHGTLLLDELNSMPLGLQAKLLRVLQEKRVRRLGSQQEIPVDVRIISILNQHPLEAINQGILRRDLFYRLAVVSLAVPRLRERREDIILLVGHVLGRSPEKKKWKLSAEVMDMFMKYHWPGNIRELEHVLEGSLAVIRDGRAIEPESLPRHFLESYHLAVPDREASHFPERPEQPTVREIPEYYDYRDIKRDSVVPLKDCMSRYESRCIDNVLRITGGNVAKAARMMETTPAGLRYRMKVLNLE